MKKKIQQKEFSSFYSQSIQRDWKTEEIRNLRIVNSLRIIFGGISLIFVILARATITPSQTFATAVAASILLLFALASHFLIRYNYVDNNLFKYIITTIDILIISILLWNFDGPKTFKSSAYIMYIPFITITAVYHSERMPIFAGFLTIAIYIGMVVWANRIGKIVFGTVDQHYFGEQISLVHIAIRCMGIMLLSSVLLIMVRRYKRMLLHIIRSERAYANQRKSTTRMLSALQRYIPKDISLQIKNVSQLEIDTVSGDFLNTHSHVSIMFCDFQSFTQIADKLQDPQEIIDLLNRYLKKMIEVVFYYSGTIDKFLGDGFMALFGIPNITDRDAELAVRAALMIRKTVANLNKEKRAQDPEMKVRIGIHCGNVVVGNVGNDTRREYTVIGQPVNIASRLEKLNKDFNTEILVSKEIVNKISQNFNVQTRGYVPLRGVHKEMEVFEILSHHLDLSEK